MGYIKTGFLEVVGQENRVGFRFGPQWFWWGWALAIKALRRFESVKHMEVVAIAVLHLRTIS
jgi:hypothetical protein